MAVVQAILTFVLDMWVVTPRIGRTLGGVPPLGEMVDY